MKKISLRTLMLVQVFLAFCIPLYYYLMVVYTLNSNAPTWIAMILLIVVSWMKRNSDGMDEYAKKAMQIADAICFKAALALMGVIIFPSLLLDGTACYVTGYLLTGGIFILVLIRAIVFCWIDKNGME